MSEIAIEPDRLKTIRRARKIGRPKLGKLAGMSERQVARLEAGGLVLSVAQLERVAQALDVLPMVLTGELAVSEDDLVQSAPKCTSGCCG